MQVSRRVRVSASTGQCSKPWTRPKPEIVTAQMDQPHVDVWGDVVSSKTRTHACRRLEPSTIRLMRVLEAVLEIAADCAYMFRLMQHFVREPLF